jgi:hypothetical protein
MSSRRSYQWPNVFSPAFRRGTGNLHCPFSLTRLTQPVRLMHLSVRQTTGRKELAHDHTVFRSGTDW